MMIQLYVFITSDVIDNDAKILLLALYGFYKAE